METIKRPQKLQKLRSVRIFASSQLPKRQIKLNTADFFFLQLLEKRVILHANYSDYQLYTGADLELKQLAINRL